MHNIRPEGTFPGYIGYAVNMMSPFNLIAAASAAWMAPEGRIFRVRDRVVPCRERCYESFAVGKKHQRAAPFKVEYKIR